MNMSMTMIMKPENDVPLGPLLQFMGCHMIPVMMRMMKGADSHLGVDPGDQHLQEE